METLIQNYAQTSLAITTSSEKAREEIERIYNTLPQGADVYVCTLEPEELKKDFDVVLSIEHAEGAYTVCVEQAPAILQGQKVMAFDI